MASMWLVVMVTCALGFQSEAKQINRDLLQRALDLLREESAPDDTSEAGLPGFATREGDDEPQAFDTLFKGKREVAGDDTSDEGIPGFITRQDDGTEAAEERGTEKGLQKRGQTNTIDVCFFCDSNCKADIGEDPTTYFNKITASVQDMYSTLSPDDTWVVRNHMTVEPGIPVPYYTWYNFGSVKAGVHLVTDVANNFWKYNKLWAGAQGAGCDIGFAVVSKDDDLWEEAGDFDGVAHMFQVCGDASYGIVKTLNSDELMATTVAHECGHLFGMYHDGAIPSGFSKVGTAFLADPVLGPAYQLLQTYCTGGDHHCPLGQHRCIMRAGGRASDVFSDCSRAYLNMFFTLSDKMPVFYKDFCIHL